MNILADTIGLNPGDTVFLYMLDFNPMGYNIKKYFTPSSQSGDSIWWQGNEYKSRDISITGFRKTGDDVPPEPTMSIGNIDKGGNALLAEYGDLLGAEVTRFKTYAQYLDKLPDGSINPTADPYAMTIPEVWYIEQKVANTPLFIQWKLSSVLDLSGKQVPRRLVLKDICMREYRVWDSTAGEFKYSMKNACPYAGSEMYDRDNNATIDPVLDVCPKHLVGCATRFREEALPGWFFPGVNRYPAR